MIRSRDGWSFELPFVVAALALAAPSPARAAESATVILVAPVGDAFEARMRAELESMGFDVQVQGALAGEPPSGVLAVTRVVPGPPRRLEVLVVSTDASSRVPSRTAVIEAPATDDEATVSVRAAEQLRAFFQPLRPPSPGDPPSATPPTPPPSVRPPDPPRTPPTRTSRATGPTPPPSAARADDAVSAPPRVSTSLALGAAFDVGGVGLDALAGARLHLGGRATLGLFVVAPLTATAIDGPEGAAAVRAVIAGLDGGVSLDLGAVRLAPSAGLALAMLVTQGEAVAPYEGRTDLASAALPFARLEIAPRIAGPVRASVQGLGGVALPSIAVRFAGREAAAWQPFAGAFAGVTIDL